jgi:hypothetical protein
VVIVIQFSQHETSTFGIYVFGFFTSSFHSGEKTLCNPGNNPVVLMNSVIKYSVRITQHLVEKGHVLILFMLHVVASLFGHQVVIQNIYKRIFRTMIVMFCISVGIIPSTGIINVKILKLKCCHSIPVMPVDWLKHVV